MPAELAMEDFIAACQRPLRRSLRVNTLKISVADFLALVQDYDWRLEPIPWCAEGFWIERDDEELRLGSAAEHLSGLFYIQEASSMLPVSALFSGGAAPNRVLDVAAAPGSKTTQIAALMGNQGGIVANEYSASRVKVLHANISRCGVKNAALTHFDGRVFGAALPESFDAILLDAPAQAKAWCAGSGSHEQLVATERGRDRRHPTRTDRQRVSCAGAGRRDGLLHLHAQCAGKPAGGALAAGHLRRRGQRRAAGCTVPRRRQGADRRRLPARLPADLRQRRLFVARLRKQRAVAPLAKPTYKVGKFPFSPLSGKEAALVAQAAAASGLTWGDDSRLWERDKELWLFPAELEPLFGKVRFSRIGLKLAERFPKGFRWQHEAAIALAGTGGKPHFELDAALAQEWYHGRDLYPEQPPAGDECIVTYQGQPLGIAKRIGSRIKNNLPRELVRDGALDFHL